MKGFLVLFFLLTISLTAAAQNNSFKIDPIGMFNKLDGKWKSRLAAPATYAGLLGVCYRYAPLRYLPFCDEISSVGASILDLHLGPYSQTAFAHEFHELSRHQEVLSSYLSGLTEGLNLAVQTRQSMNLWDWTLGFFNGDANSALQMIAIMYQDVSGFASYNVQPFIGGSDELMQKFDTSISLIQSARLEKASDGQKILAVYPNFIKASSKSLYHFYVMAYLAKSIAANKLIPNEWALLIPMELEMFYEFVYNKNGRKDQKAQVRDLYLTYAGASWGLSNQEKILTEDEFSYRFEALGPRAFLNEALKNVD